MSEDAIIYCFTGVIFYSTLSFLGARVFIARSLNE